MSTTYCTDTDLLCWEPNLFIDAMFTSQTLLEGTGDLAGATFTIDAGSLEASHVAAGQVIVLAGGTTGTYPIVGVATDTQLVVSVLYDGLFPVGASPDPSPIGAATDLSFAIRTFSPQAKVVSDWMMRSIGIDADSGIAILNESALRRPCAAGTLAMIFSAMLGIQPLPSEAQRTRRS